MGGKRPIRKARLGAVCALSLVCALGTSASVAQDSATDTSTKKPATTRKTTSSSTEHKSASSAGTASSKTHSTSSKKHSSRKKTARVRGQQKIDSERAQAIQEALIREHYLTGEATGQWNEASEAAMRRFQADNGWQSVVVPDSRALIKLGLGPSKDHLLNPESAMTTVPDRPKAEPVQPASHAAPTHSDPPPPAPPSTAQTSNTSSPQ